MIRVDHIGISAHDARASASTLAEILGAPEPTPDGADGDMFRVDLDEGSCLLFSASEKIDVTHIAFKVDLQRFAGVVERLRQRGVAFGNDPEDPRNGSTDDFMGGAGRVYFVDENGHLFEVTC